MISIFKRPLASSTIIWKVWKYCPTVLIALSLLETKGQVPQTPALHDSVNTYPLTGKDSVPIFHEGYSFIIGDFFIKGNRITKRYIIEREFGFKKGDTVNLHALVADFVKTKEHLMNTRLFNDVVISLKAFRGFFVDIEVDVKERWYIFPLPYVRPVDRNFTAWAEKNYSLARLDYGLKYSHYNFTGRNDFVRLWLLTGYTNSIEFAYDQPYADKSLKHGFGLGFYYGNLRELNVMTVSNQQFFLNSDTVSYAGRYLLEQSSFYFRYYYRPAIKTRHLIRLNFNTVKIDSAVTVANPHYFNGNNTHIFYPELSYVMTYNNVDYVPYPLKGFLLETGFLKRGINADMNMWQLSVKTNEGIPLARKTYFVAQNMATIRFPFDQPFYNQQLIGYGDYYLRGLEKYVVDGQIGVVARNNLLRELFNFKIPFLRGTSHDVIPIRIFAKAYFDCGYAYNSNFRDNSLVNQILYSGGVGIDVVTFYDFVFRFEYSINQLGEKGLFFHIRNDF